MGTGYIRQASANIGAGLLISAADLNSEYNQLQSAFNGTTGHAHDATTGNGPKLDLTASTTGTLATTRGALPTGGTQFQTLIKNSASDFDAVWAGPISGRNFAINGDCEVWQRGAGNAASIAVGAGNSAYTADRWLCSTAASAASTVSQQGGLTVNSRYCARVQRNSGQTGTAISFQQPLTFDQIIPLRGQIVTISAKVRSGSNFSPTSGAITFALLTGTTATEAISTNLTGTTTPATVTTNLGTGSAVTTITATSAAIVPTNAAQGALIFLWATTGTASTNDYVEIDEVQIEIGDTATTFDRRLFADEMARCQRFCEKSFPYGTAPAQSTSALGAVAVDIPTGASGVFSAMVSFRAVKRVAPTVTLYNYNQANGNWRDFTNSADRTAFTQALGEGSFGITGAAGVAASKNLIHWLADAEI